MMYVDYETNYQRPQGLMTPQDYDPKASSSSSSRTLFTGRRKLKSIFLDRDAELKEISKPSNNNELVFAKAGKVGASRPSDILPLTPTKSPLLSYDYGNSNHSTVSANNSSGIRIKRVLTVEEMNNHNNNDTVSMPPF